MLAEPMGQTHTERMTWLRDLAASKAERDTPAAKEWGDLALWLDEDLEALARISAKPTTGEGG